MKAEKDARTKIFTVVPMTVMADAFKEYIKANGVPVNKQLVRLIEPHMPKINKFTGQENDVRYICYLLEHLYSEYGNFLETETL